MMRNEQAECSTTIVIDSKSQCKDDKRRWLDRWLELMHEALVVKTDDPKVVRIVYRTEEQFKVIQEKVAEQVRQEIEASKR